MDFLFDSRGRHIANAISDQLHAPSGRNIGHFLKEQGIYIDMNGRYLGEIVSGDRFLRKRGSPHASANYGVFGNYGNVGNYGNPGNHGTIGVLSGYEDVGTPWLG
jgi:hypothetical protein